MDKPNFDEVTKRVLSDHDYQNVYARTVDVWLLMSACQYMVVSPVIHETLRDTYRDLGKRLQAVVVTIHPEAKELADRGWDTYVDAEYGVGTGPLPWFWNHDDDDDDYDDDDDELSDIPI